MKIKTVKKIAHAYLSGRYYPKVSDWQWFSTGTDGQGFWYKNAILHPAVERYIRETVGWCDTAYSPLIVVKD